MNFNDVLNAEIETKRFLEKLNIYKERLNSGETKFIYQCSERAALRRSSMDLTKALSKMRKGVVYGN